MAADRQSNVLEIMLSSPKVLVMLKYLLGKWLISWLTCVDWANDGWFGCAKAFMIAPWAHIQALCSPGIRSTHNAGSRIIEDDLSCAADRAASKMLLRTGDPAYESRMSRPTMQAWIKPPCITDSFGESILKGVSKKARKYSGSF